MTYSSTKINRLHLLRSFLYSISVGVTVGSFWKAGAAQESHRTADVIKLCQRRSENLTTIAHSISMPTKWKAGNAQIWLTRGDKRRQGGLQQSTPLMMLSNWLVCPYWEKGPQSSPLLLWNRSEFDTWLALSEIFLYSHFVLLIFSQVLDSNLKYHLAINAICLQGSLTKQRL